MNAEQASGHDGLSRLSSDSGEIETYYDDWADDYDDTLSQWRYQAPEQAASILRRHLASSDLILDAGCGTGLTGAALARAGFTMIDGIDISTRSLAAADARGVYRSLTQVNMQQLPLPHDDDTYDGLECIGVLTYLPDSEQLFREFCRVVRAKGIVIMTQRSDLYEERDFGSVLGSVEREGLWEIIEISEPKPYLPENEEFADSIMVRYITCRVREPGSSQPT